MWNYARLSMLAKTKGGPEKLVNFIFKNGIRKGRIQMIPIILLAILVGVSATLLIQYFRDKQKCSDKELEYAKKELIQGIEDYDAEH